MGAPQDFLLDENYDLIIATNGDFAVGDCNEVDADLLINTSRGNWKESPMVGFGMPAYLDADLTANDIDQMQAAIKLQLTADGFTVEEIDVLLSNGGVLGVTLKKADRQI